MITPQNIDAPKHRKYCAKSGLACLVYHSNGICPDVRDCEACALDLPPISSPSGTQLNTQNIDGEMRKRFENLQTKLFVAYELVLSTGAESAILAFMQKEIDAAVRARTEETIKTLKEWSNSSIFHHRIKAFGAKEGECDEPHCDNGHYPLGMHEDGEVDWGACPKCKPLDGFSGLPQFAKPSPETELVQFLVNLFPKK